MRTTIPSTGGLLSPSIVLCILLVAGCATGTPGTAPVHDRSASRKPATVAPASEAREGGTHVAQRGETLYSIARQYGQDPKNIIIWNQLENPNSIAPGQRIFVAPPGSSPAGGGSADATIAEVKTVTPQAGVEAKPLTGWPAPVTPGTAPAAPAAQVPPASPAGSIKQEPRGGKQPYSEQAWARARAADEKPGGAAATVPPSPSGEPKPTPKTDEARPGGGDAKPDAKPDSKSDGKPDEKSDARPANGALDWSWPTGGKVVAGFNDSTSKGIDINGKLGDPVHAAAPGKVLYAGQDLRGYGKLVVLKHANQYLSVYAHNNEILVKEGQAVARGQKIAELGKSDAPEPKLHFEIRRQGKPVDPLQYLPPR